MVSHKLSDQHWHVAGFGLVVREGDAITICDVHATKFSKLIAAAPKLLNALREVTEIATLFAGHVKDGIADVAIEKAVKLLDEFPKD
jgi:hypothetical protein